MNLSFSKRRKKGLSLIELVVALSLISLILMIVGPFFLSNYRSLNKTSNQIDFQREAKSVMNYFTDSAMEAAGVKSINNNGTNIDLSKFNSTSGEKISISFYDEGGVITTFSLKNGNLFYKKGKANEVELSQNITKMYLDTNSDTTFDNTKSIKITLTFNKNNADEYSVDNLLTLRNKN